MDIRKKHTHKTYSVIAPLYIEDFEKNYENFHYVDDVLKLRDTRRLNHYPIVDLGSGPGTTIDYILKKSKKQTSIIAVDFNQHFCERMNRKYLMHNHVKIVCEDMASFVKDQRPSSIGIYIASYSLIHIPDWEIDELFNHIKRSLVKNGLFLFSCYKGTYKGLEQERYQVIGDSRLSHDATLLCYMNYFTEAELEERLVKSGMQIVKMETLPASKNEKDMPHEQIWVIAEKT